MRILPFNLRKLASHHTVYTHKSRQNISVVLHVTEIFYSFITFVQYNVHLYILHLLSNLNKTIK